MEQVTEESLAPEKKSVDRIPLFGPQSDRAKAKLSGIQSLQCTKAPVDHQEAIIDTPQTENRANDIQIATTMSCATCGVSFSSREAQMIHFKTDWHRYNIKQRLRNCKCVSEQSFIVLADNISSLSGTDCSESDTEEKATQRLKCLVLASQKPTDEYDSESDEEYDLAHGLRQGKVYLMSSAGQIISLYQAVLCAKGSKETTDALVTTAKNLPNKNLWIIIMIGAGHFAGAVFKDGVPIEHKTFHRYVIRAKAGTAQSSHDEKGKAARSAGAQLRRYNEMALGQDISDLLSAWSTHLKECHMIFVRVSNNSSQYLFGKKDSPLSKKDQRLRTIPFPTRRPTFNEVKRVFTQLSTVECYDVSVTADRLFPRSKKTARKKLPKVNNDNQYSGSSSSHESDPNDEPCDLLCEDLLVDFGDLKEFDHFVPASVQEAPFERASRKSRSKQTKENTDGLTQQSSSPLSPALPNQSEMYTACKIGDRAGLESLVASLRLHMCAEELSSALCKPIDQHGHTLLHVASQQAHSLVVRYLLESGCDPAVSDRTGEVPYLCTQNKTVRNAFRKFMAEFPERYDYTTAKVPGPLTEDMEQQKQKKEAERRKELNKKKRERVKAKAQVDLKVKEEEEERKRYLSLSDREKRALAAEKRILAQTPSASSANVSIVKVLSRCYQCAADITGKVPFEYSNYVFCSPACLKTHRQINRQGIPH